jgi:Domain of unknown function (DUF222)
MQSIIGSENADTLMGSLIEAERELRALRAERYRALSALAGHPLYAGDMRGAVIVAARALRISERAAAAEITDAVTLTRLFPEALDQLAAGTVQDVQVRALVEATAPLDDAAARRAQDLVLPHMPGQNPAATREALNRAVIEADPAAARKPRGHTARKRRVVPRPEPGGMGALIATLPAE